MRIGFVGAGKVGFSLGRYFTEHGIHVSGYYSRNPRSAMEAAEFTGTGSYETLEDLVRDSEVVFITVPDDVIASVWEEMKALQIAGKAICHCSGVLSSDIFSEKAAHHCCGYSIHPLLAFSDKLHSYQELSQAVFTIEGDNGRQQEMTDLLRRCGNEVIAIHQEEKARYHAAAVFASNLMLGLAETAVEELIQCGFARETARAALAPLMEKNIAHLRQHSPEEALTGPMERNDRNTVKRHLDTLSGDHREIYRLLSREALAIAQRKHPERDYEKMEELLYE